MFMEEVASLNFMERDDDIFEEDDVFFSEGNCKAWDNACQNVKKFRGSVELKGFMDEAVEAIVDGFSDHFSSGNQFGVETMKNVF